MSTFSAKRESTAAGRHDTYGNNTSVSISSGGTNLSSFAAYTANGNLLSSTTDALGNVTNYSYDTDTGVLEWVQFPEDTESTRTEYTYDEMYRVASIAADTDSQLNLSANYTYTDEDLLATLQTPSTTYTFTYGDFDQRTAVMIGSRTLVSYSYDSKKQLDRLTYGNSDFVDYDYDAKGRLIKQTYETGETVEYAYDNSGNLATVTDSATGITTTYYYDLLDRQVGYREKSQTLDHSVTCIYNEDNQVSSVTEIINGTTTTYSYTYDEDNRVTSVTVGNVTVNYSYDGFGRLENRTVKNGDTVIQSNTPTYSAGKEANTTTGQISSYNGYTYTYDKNGNILSISDGTYTTSYEYDSANQLTRENNQQLGFTHTWTYDNAGNIRSRSEYAYTTGELGTPTNTVEYAYKSSTIWGDMIDAYGANDYLPHDGTGNLRYDGTWIYNWENGRELVSMTQGETAWTFSYDANGMRTGRHHSSGYGYEYIYDGSQLVQMNTGSGALYFTYDASGIPLTLTYNNATYYYITNLQGDVVGLLDSTGAQIAAYAYDAWGNVTVTSDNPLATLNPLTYRGYVYDWEIGLYYLQSRYYNPEWGRFINADGYYSTGQGFVGNNMFAYCGNNPVVRLEVGGYFWDIVLDIFSFGASIVEVIENPDDPWAWAGLGLDLVDLIVPFVSGLGEGLDLINTTRKLTNTADNITDVYKVANTVDGFGDLSRAKEFGIKAYNQLRKVLKGTGLQAHHVIEKRLVKYLGIDVNTMLSVALTPAEHRIFTNLWRQNFRYGLDYEYVTKNRIWEVAQEIYKDYPDLISASWEILFG